MKAWFGPIETFPRLTGGPASHGLCSGPAGPQLLTSRRVRKTGLPASAAVCAYLTLRADQGEPTGSMGLACSAIRAPILCQRTAQAQTGAVGHRPSLRSSETAQRPSQLLGVIRGRAPTPCRRDDGRNVAAAEIRYKKVSILIKPWGEHRRSAAPSRRTGLRSPQGSSGPLCGTSVRGLCRARGSPQPSCWGRQS